MWKVKCKCAIPAFSSPRKNPLSPCYFYCGCGSDDVSSCDFQVTVLSISYSECYPTVFLYEVIQSGEVFDSFRNNSETAYLEFMGVIPRLTIDQRHFSLIIDEIDLKEHEQFHQTVQSIKGIVTLLNIINEISFKCHYTDHSVLTWQGKIRLFYDRAVAQMIESNCNWDGFEREKICLRDDLLSFFSKSLNQ